MNRAEARHLAGVIELVLPASAPGAGMLVGTGDRVKHVARQAARLCMYETEETVMQPWTLEVLTEPLEGAATMERADREATVAEAGLANGDVVVPVPG